MKSGPPDEKTVVIGDETMVFWWIALAVLLVVTLVVAGLLYWLQNRAREIDRLLGAIWRAGQRVAGNTVHVPKLYGIADAAEATSASAGRTLTGADAIATHAERCPGCPACILREERR